MPRDKDFKRLVRKRMRKTGESYSSARAHLLSAAGHPRSSCDLLRKIGQDVIGRATSNFENLHSG